LPTSRMSNSNLRCAGYWIWRRNTEPSLRHQELCIIRFIHPQNI